jgi:hypothetical protein
MKILHTITCTKFQKEYNAYEEFTRHLVRERNLTFSGIERMMRNGCEEYGADEQINVIRVESAIYQK